MAVPKGVRAEIAQWLGTQAIHASTAPVRCLYAVAAEEARQGKFDDGTIKLIGDAIDYATDAEEEGTYRRWLNAIRG